MFWIHFILMWTRIRIRGSTSGNRGSGSDLKSKKFQFFFHLTFWVKIHTLLKTMFFVASLMSLLFMCVNQWFLWKNIWYFIILVDFYVNIKIFSLLPGTGSTFPEVNPDPAKWYGPDRIRNTENIRQNGTR